jgi:hypothetical protein
MRAVLTLIIDFIHGIGIQTVRKKPESHRIDIKVESSLFNQVK